MCTVDTEVTPKHLADNNIIICQKRLNPRQMSRRLERDVMNIKDEVKPSAGVIYALKLNNSTIWSRAVVKFHRDDGVIVIQSIDMPGVFDFEPGILLRRIQSPELKDLKPSIFKLMIYGIAKYEPGDEFKMIFKQTIQNNEKTVVISRLMEQRTNITKQCYAGDILFYFNNQYRSFREVLVREKISYPARVQENINQLIFQKRTQFLLNKNEANSVSASTLCFVESAVAQSQNQNDALGQNDALPPVEPINGKFMLNRIIGEGSVSSFFFCTKSKNLHQRLNKSENSISCSSVRFLKRLTFKTSYR